jgi:hypothetical protein
MTEDQIKYMADRFLGWTVPEDFNPDAGINFIRTPNRLGGGFFPLPVGTNILDARQAEEMVRYLIEGLPPSIPAEPAVESVRKIVQFTQEGSIFHALDSDGVLWVCNTQGHNEWEKLIIPPLPQPAEIKGSVE